ncbi:MAG: PBP1A family penicillin-binding protein [Clostridia bacterium]|nr:PBP1A family penicillin-binding protein [Clostridia bacterium]
MAKKRRKKMIKILLLTCIFLFITMILISIIYISKIDTNIDYTFDNLRKSSITRVYYYDFLDRKNRIGVPVELQDEEIFQNKSEWVSIEDIPNNLINAFIAVEDKRFYDHSGVDWLRTVKAIFNYLFKFEDSSFGGSTITQQLIKNLTGENDNSPKRKINEIFRALKLEKKLDKKEILEIYLNVVYLSQNCYGVNTASKVYFNKELKDLSLTECASLASIVKSPKYYDPYMNYENNTNRIKTVLALMYEQNMITTDEYQNSLNEVLLINENVENLTQTGTFSWYTEALIDDVSNDLSKKYNISKESARQYILRGGLNIYSLVDPRIQNECETVYENYVKYLTPQKQGYPQSSCIVLDPYTSDILGIVGGIGKKDSNLILNRATNTKRPPGSVLKPLSVYAPAIEEGVTTYSSVYDDTPLILSSGKYWPKNSPEKYRGLVPISLAVERSLNTVSVKVLREVGINRSLKYLNKLGINYNNSDNNESSLALGQLTNGESLLNMSNAYCSFVNGGKISNPKTYLYVTDVNGNIILKNDSKITEVFSEETAYITTKLLANVVKNGTGKGVDVENIEIAGKTGTSSNNEDKWFIGYSPYFVCGVWNGYDIPKPIYTSKNPSVLVFNELMTAFHQNVKSGCFNTPKNIVEREFCADSGLLPSNACSNDLRGSRTMLGYYKEGTEPEKICDIHKEVIVDKTTNNIPNYYLPFWKKKKISLLDYDRIEYSDLMILDNQYLIKNRIAE